MKKGTKVKHFDTGIWRHGTFEGKSPNPDLCLVLFDDAKTLNGQPMQELVRLDEIEVQSEDANG